MVVVVICLIFAALWIDALCRIVWAAFTWAPILFCAVAAMHWIASLHLSDPLASLYAFFIAGMSARVVLTLALTSARPKRPAAS